MSVTSEEEGEDDKFLSDEHELDNDEDANSNGSDASSGSGDEHSRAPPLLQHNFAPPFYGRPPTPLPPSPSLTSLLRPSRPTTPDASDDDGLLDANGGPLPRTSPKVPTYEYYGFVLYLFSSLTFLIYLLWSYLPSPFLHVLGITYYPDRWWSLAVPSFLVMALVYTYVALAAYNTEILTLPMESVETIVDEAAQIAVVDSQGRIRKADGGARRRGHDRRVKERRRERDGRRSSEQYGQVVGSGGLNWKEVWNHGTDAVMDIPLAGVCEVLYGEERERGIVDEDDVFS